jgi:hypothetical protein
LKNLISINYNYIKTNVERFLEQFKNINYKTDN